jgi:hypothetical protein
MKKKTTARLKKDLDKLFSEFIRRKYANQEGQVRCYTCGVTKDWKAIQNGHFVSRSHLATRFDEDNCRPQCVGCNVFGQGRVAVFASKLDQEIGEGTVARLYMQAQKIVKDYPYEERISYYKNKLSELN